MTTTNGHSDATAPEFIGCHVKQPVDENKGSAKGKPVETKSMARMLRESINDATGKPEPGRLAALKDESIFWGRGGVRLTVDFMDNPPRALRTLILRHMNAWSQHANVEFVEFVEATSVGQVRIAFKRDGHWSLLGKKILQEPQNLPTMNLQLTLDSGESEIRRVVRHETGHTLGFHHEHLRKDIVNRIDVQKAYEFYEEDQGWKRQTIKDNVLAPLHESWIEATEETDQISIMCYPVPAKVMKDNKEVPGGQDISATDAKFVAVLYPKSNTWKAVDERGNTASIVADDANLYQLNGSGDISQYSNTPIPEWRELGENAKAKKIVAANGLLYRLSEDGTIYQFTRHSETKWQSLGHNENTVDIASGGDNLYQLHKSGRIYKYAGSTEWRLLGNNAKTEKIVAAEDHLYQLHNDGLIYKYTEGEKQDSWQRLGANAKTIDLVAHGNDLYQLHSSGEIWKYTGEGDRWFQLDRNKNCKAIAAGDAGLYQIHNNGEIWQYLGQNEPRWKKLGVDGENQEIVVGNWLYKVNKDGKVYRWN